MSEVKELEKEETKEIKAFKDMKESELHDVCDSFGVEHEGLNKPAMLAGLAEDGVQFSTYQRLINAKHEDPTEILEVEPQADELFTKPERPTDPEVILLKMDRNNRTFDILGFHFTQDHPFAVMSTDEAQKIIDLEEGFRIASPREASEYYK